MDRRISKPISGIKKHYDVVVVGSGYGGGVAASRMARAGKKVCVSHIKCDSIGRDLFKFAK